MEVRIGDEPPGDVGGAAVIENALLELPQGGRAESVAPQPTRGMQEIKVRVVDGELAVYRHHETRADDRNVERLAVVRGTRAKRLDLFLQALNEVALRPEIQKHVLPQHKLFFGEMSDANQKDVRARPARESRRLNIEEQHVQPVARRIAL